VRQGISGKIKEMSPGKIGIILKETNDGPGASRNEGIKWAYERNLPIILF
jgi:hypothetical protein